MAVGGRWRGGEMAIELPFATSSNFMLSSHAILLPQFPLPSTARTSQILLKSRVDVADLS